MVIHLGENIRKYRKQKGITQENFATRIGVTFQAVSKWERDESYPDIEVLPLIAVFFGVTIDALLGANRNDNEDKIQGYLSLYDTMHCCRTSELFSVYRKAVDEFPNDFRILVRYMDLLSCEYYNPFVKDDLYEISKDLPQGCNDPYKLGWTDNPDYEKASRELLRVYEKIQSHCTDDSIRIWSKHIMIDYLMNKYDLSYDKNNGKWRCDKEAQQKAEEILVTLPMLCDARELVELRVNENPEKHMDICRRNIEELAYHLQENISSYCYFPYDNGFSAEYKIGAITYVNGIMQMVDNDGYVSKNRMHLMYNYGQLCRLYAEIGDYDKAIENMKNCVDYAVGLDSDPDELERISRFYKEGSSLADMSVCERMKLLFTEHYPLPDEFRQSVAFRDILSIL